jgi:hypothetical protein
MKLLLIARLALASAAAALPFWLAPMPAAPPHQQWSVPVKIPVRHGTRVPDIAADGAVLSINVAAGIYPTAAGDRRAVVCAERWPDGRRRQTWR